MARVCIQSLTPGWAHLYQRMSHVAPQGCLLLTLFSLAFFPLWIKNTSFSFSTVYADQWLQIFVLRFVIWRCFYDYVPLLWYHVAWTWIEVWERSWKDQTFIQLIFFTHLVSIIRASLIGGASHSSVVKNPPASADDAGSIPGWGRRKGSRGREGSGNPAQYSCLGNAMDRGAWLTQSMGLEKGWMRVNKQQQSGIESQIQSLEHSRPREHCPTVESSLPVLSSMEVTSSLWLLGLWSVASVRNWSVHYI